MTKLSGHHESIKMTFVNSTSDRSSRMYKLPDHYSKQRGPSPLEQDFGKDSLNSKVWLKLQISLLDIGRFSLQPVLQLLTQDRCTTLIWPWLFTPWPLCRHYVPVFHDRALCTLPLKKDQAGFVLCELFCTLVRFLLCQPLPHNHYHHLCGTWVCWVWLVPCMTAALGNLFQSSRTVGAQSETQTEWWTSSASSFLFWNRKYHSTCLCLSSNSHPHSPSLSYSWIQVWFLQRA